MANAVNSHYFLILCAGTLFSSLGKAPIPWIFNLLNTIKYISSTCLFVPLCRCLSILIVSILVTRLRLSHSHPSGRRVYGMWMASFFKHISYLLKYSEALLACLQLVPRHNVCICTTASILDILYIPKEKSDDIFLRKQDIFNSLKRFRIGDPLQFITSPSARSSGDNLWKMTIEVKFCDFKGANIRQNVVKLVFLQRDETYIHIYSDIEQ